MSYSNIPGGMQAQGQFGGPPPGTNFAPTYAAMPPHHPHHMAGVPGMQQAEMHPSVQDGEYTHKSSVLGEPNASPISATAFDSVEELVWIGTRAVSHGFSVLLCTFCEFYTPGQVLWHHTY